VKVKGGRENPIEYARVVGLSRARKERADDILQEVKSQGSFMTLLAGVFSRSKQTPVPASICDSLHQYISRNSVDEVRVFEDSRCFLAKVDIGAFGESAFIVDDDRNVSMLAGEPLLARGEDDNDWQSRTRDLEVLHESWLRGDWNTLTRVRGVFCGLHYQSATGTLSLIADKLAIRPLFYWKDDRYVVFASALRILESVAQIPKSMDVRGVTEMVGFGMPLGGRTPYQNIARLEPAEIVHVSGDDIFRSQYWRWDDIPTSRDPEPKLLSEIYNGFTSAVTRRIRNDTTTVAYLSGGLDSRCIVAALRSRDVRVHTFNFGRRNTQDQFFASEFARNAGTIHEETPMGDRSPDLSAMLAGVLRDSKNRPVWPAERAALVWAGFGGNEILGQTHITKSVVELMRAGETDAAVEASLFERTSRVPQKLLNKDVAQDISKTLHRGMLEALDDIHSADPAHRFSVLLMMKRGRNLSDQFENIDLHRLEYQLPFLDSDFVAAVTAVPLDLRLSHKFYAKLLALFPPAVTSTPWQTYPGHEPCPIPVPKELSYQWGNTYQASLSKSRKRAALKEAAGLLRMNKFPNELLNRRNLLLATLIHWLGFRNYEYVINAAQIYCKYWTLCDGRYSID
jgi:asparagine synthetase B (glutamine-hydrolysing)